MSTTRAYVFLPISEHDKLFDDEAPPVKLMLTVNGNESAYGIVFSASNDFDLECIVIKRCDPVDMGTDFYALLVQHRADAFIPVQALCEMQYAHAAANQLIEFYRATYALGALIPQAPPP